MQLAHFRRIDEVILVDIECNEILLVARHVIILLLVARSVTALGTKRERKSGQRLSNCGELENMNSINLT